ncbi:GGDEF domain-containing protein [Streptomyces purpurascens]|uniref:GGDEF domain-containing protein n=1 Tax=Streptomyces purpurascens TaxID=1924 RepID=UPI0016777498|nr:GGDEF domain-containing protein [Streptomyces purpurascens]MCE7051898.1 GGDEF domain-containing protein [Streptomyces purpurascens]GHA59217.1 GGDEF domain-containing protein [Streptomyces purpurascens]
MPATAVLRQPSRTLVITATAVPLALAVLADDVRVRRQLHAARRDPLSGLPGRTDLLAYGDRLLRTGRRNRVHVMLLDGNGFKAINDTYGHATGDAVIATTGRRLAAWTTRRQAVAARLGGDEFAIAAVLPDRSALADITALREQLHQPLTHDGLTLRMTVSLGIARAADLPGEDTGRLLRAADAAMYKVKTGDAAFPYLATRADAYADTVNGRRDGRPGTHLPAA